MRFCVLGVVQAHTSYHSVLLLLAAQYGVATPCVETVRSWVLRLGLYLLQELPYRRADWVWIIDHTLQWGTARCLVILGVSQAHLNAHGFRLRHADVGVLAVEVVEHSDGEVVQQQLTALAARVGVPRQIVSDHGADLTKGIRLFQQVQPTVIDTYDVTHKMACLLKGLLAHDERWQAFVRQCAATGARVRQTAGSFLLPPTLRAKARYMNLEALLNWAERMQGLETPADTLRLAAALELSVTAASAWWQETFGWLEEFRSDLDTWSQYWELVCRAEAQVRAAGLSVAAGRRYRASLPPPRGSDARVPWLAEQIEAFLSAEGGKAGTGPALLGSSEVIESVFGSYKQYVERSVWSEIGSNVLLLPVLLVTVTTALLGRALQAVRGREVWAWCREHLGKSRQQRFREVFGKTQANKAAPGVARLAGNTSTQADVPSPAPPAEGAAAGRPPPAETRAPSRPSPDGKVAA
jgi:hypothetical protein